MSFGYVSVGSGDNDSQVTGPESTYLAGSFFSFLVAGYSQPRVTFPLNLFVLF